MTTAPKTEEEPAHTPGPWKVYGHGLYMNELAGKKHGSIFADDDSNDGDGRNICEIAASQRIVFEDKRRHDDFVHSHEDEANARLIAAAPDMLAALKEVAEVASSTQSRFTRQAILKYVAAAVAKAEGGAS